jgi:argininosuccinate synthase
MKIVLAYSGGLDTSVALHWMREHYGAEMYAYCADIGQSDDLEALREKALTTGATDVLVEDVRETYLTDYVLPSLRANAAYDRQYLLAAPLSRPLISERMVRYARQVGADAVAHGATGKGNDQIRFFASVTALNPRLTVLAPVMTWKLRTREDEVAYAAQHDIPVEVSKARPYSIDTNIWGTSIECGVLDDISSAPPDDIYLITADPGDSTGADEITVDFDRGTPCALDGRRLPPIELVQRLNVVAGRHGIGRIDIIENRVLGFKTRGVYECPAGVVLRRAHQELESVVLDRDTLHFAESLSQRYGQLIYDGLWFSPLRRALDQFFAATQGSVTGRVRLRLSAGRIDVLRRESERSLYQENIATYGDGDTFDHSAGAGLAYTMALPLRLGASVDVTPADRR